MARVEVQREVKITDQDILPFDSSAAEQYATIVSRRDADGTPISVLEAPTAAICIAREAELATRYVKDFRGLPLTIHNPWAARRQSRIFRGRI